ncbi:MAG: DUF58 domain-containing protein [Roseiflexus sp.]
MTRIVLDSVRRIWRRLTLDGKIRVLRPPALFAGPLLLLLALVAPYRWLFFLAYGCLILTLASYWWVRYIGPRLRLDRCLGQKWAQVGDVLEETWDLHNRAYLPVLWLEIDDLSTIPGYSARRIVSVDRNDHCTWTTGAVCVQRGIYTLGPLQARTADPFGIFGYAWREKRTRQIVIYPPLAHMTGLTLPSGQSGRVARADILRRHTTPGASSVREYAPGDMLNHVHWPTVARTNRLMVKEFDQEHAGTIWIALDLCSEAYREPTHIRAAVSAPTGLQSSVLPDAPHFWETPLELAVVVAASLAAQALREERLVGFLADDGRPRRVQPERGPRQLWRIMEELADVRATGILPVGEVVRRERRSGVALAVITPALDGAWLPALAEWQRGRLVAALAVLIAPAPLRTSSLEEQLANLGALSYTCVVGQPLPLLNPPRPHTALRVSPLGKVIGDARRHDRG